MKFILLVLFLAFHHSFGIGLFDYDSLYSEFGGVCGSREIRLETKLLKWLEKCEVVLGHVRISDIEANITSNFTFPTLKHVTHYVLIDNVTNLESVGKLFPNLKTIQGEETFRGFSLWITNNLKLERLGLKSLKIIQSGGVKVKNNTNLCFASTVDWKRITINETRDQYLDFQNDPDSCPKCSTSQNCWDENESQEECNCSKCGSETDICDPAKKFTYSQKVKPFFELGTRFKINKTACTNMGLISLDLKCITIYDCNVLAHHIYNETTGKCEYCDRNCNKKPCPEVSITSIDELKNYTDNKNFCTTMKNLTIDGLEFSEEENIQEILQLFLSTVNEIENCAIISNSSAITKLNFFHSLMKIPGSCEYNGKKYSLIVVDNPNLQTVFSKNSQLQLKNGVLIKNNKNLCKFETDVIKTMRKVNLEMSQYQTDCENPIITFEALTTNTTMTVFTDVVSDDPYVQTLKCLGTYDSINDIIDRNYTYDNANNGSISDTTNGTISDYTNDTFSDNTNNSLSTNISFAENIYNVLELTALSDTFNYNCHVEIKKGNEIIPGTDSKLIQPKSEIKFKTCTPDSDKLTFQFDVHEKNRQYVIALKKNDIYNETKETIPNKLFFEDISISSESLIDYVQNTFGGEITKLIVPSLDDRSSTAKVFEMEVGGLKSSTKYEYGLYVCINSTVVSCRKVGTGMCVTDAAKTKLWVLLLICSTMVGLAVIYAYIIIRRDSKREKDYFESTSDDYDNDIEDLKQQLQGWQIERSNILELFYLGNGNFGEVLKGLLVKEDSDIKEPVAIKSVKLSKSHKMTDEEFLREKEKNDINFMKEALRMTKLDSHHIVRLIGLCVVQKPYWLVMEYMEHGDLRTFLIKNKVVPPLTTPCNTDLYTQFTPNEPQTSTSSLESEGEKFEIRPLIHMALEVADGMAYLEDKKYVHRDLASRNCMVGANLEIKIGDFGLTRFIDTDRYYRTKDSQVPFKWMPLETLQHDKFSNKSDVWSFGVLLWEIATFGAEPYPTIHKHHEMIDHLSQGNTLGKPPNCTDDIYDLMKRCWKFKAMNRINFEKIITKLLRMLTESDEDKVFFEKFKETSFFIKKRSEKDVEKVNNDETVEVGEEGGDKNDEDQDQDPDEDFETVDIDQTFDKTAEVDDADDIKQAEV